MDSEFISTMYVTSMAMAESNNALLGRIIELENRINSIHIVPYFSCGVNRNYSVHEYFSTIR